MFTLMKINCTVTLLRENLNFHWNILVKFELKIIKEARKELKMVSKSSQYILFWSNECSNHANIARSGLFESTSAQIMLIKQ